MPRLAPKRLRVDGTERQQLQQLINRHSTPQQIAMRAEIIMLADQGHNHRDIASILKISRDMARLWRERWLARTEKGVPVVERLQDAERCGTPASFSLEQILHLFALACDNPVNYGRTISHWTARELADEMYSLKGLNQRFQKRLAQVNTTPWIMATGEDLRWPTTSGGQLDRMSRFMQYYIDQVMQFSVDHPEAYQTFGEVAHLVTPPKALFRASILALVLMQAISGTVQPI